LPAWQSRGDFYVGLGKYPACEREPDKKRNPHQNREYPERESFHDIPSDFR
jgi:hypothetical protein